MQNQDSIFVIGYSGVELEKCLSDCVDEECFSENEIIKRFVRKNGYFQCNRDNIYIVLISYFGKDATGICIASRTFKTKREIWIDYVYSEHKGHGSFLIKEMEKQLYNRFMFDLKRPNIYIMSVEQRVGFYESLGYYEIVVKQDPELEAIYIMAKSLVPYKEKIKTYENCSVSEMIRNGFNTGRLRFIKPYFKPELINLLINDWKDIPKLSDYLNVFLYVEETLNTNDTEILEIKRQRLREIMIENIQTDDLDEIIMDYDPLS